MATVKEALNEANENGGGTIDLSSETYVEAEMLTEDTNMVALTNTGTYTITGGDGVLLNYEVEVNPDKADGEYVVNVEDAFLTMGKFTLRLNTTVNVAESRIDFDPFLSSGPSYLSVYNNSVLNVENSIIGYNPRQAGVDEPSEPATENVDHNRWIYGPTMQIYGTANFTNSTVYSWVGDGSGTGLDASGNGTVTATDSNLYVGLLNVGYNFTSKYYDYEQEDILLSKVIASDGNLNSTMILDNTVVKQTQYPGDNGAGDYAIKVGSDTVIGYTGKLVIKNSSEVDFTVREFNKGLLVGNSGSSVEIVDSTLKVSSVTNNGTISVSGNSAITAVSIVNNCNEFMIGGQFNPDKNGKSIIALEDAKDTVLVFDVGTMSGGHIYLGNDYDAAHTHTLKITGDAEFNSGIYQRGNGVIEITGATVKSNMSNASYSLQGEVNVTNSVWNISGGEVYLANRGEEKSVAKRATMTLDNSTVNYDYNNFQIANNISGTLSADLILKNGSTIESKVGIIIGENGTISVMGSTLKTAKLQNAGAVTVSGESSLSINTIENSGTINMDYSSTLKFDSIDNTGTITVDMDGADEYGIYKVVDSVDNSLTVDNYGKISLKNKGDYKLIVGDGDLWAINVDMSNIKVNSKWASKDIGTEVAEGVYYGFNAFDSIADAVNSVADDGKIVFEEDASLTWLEAGKNISKNLNFQKNAEQESVVIVAKDSTPDTLYGANFSGNMTIGEGLTLNIAPNSKTENFTKINNDDKDITLQIDGTFINGGGDFGSYEATADSKKVIVNVSETGKFLAYSTDNTSFCLNTVVNVTGTGTAEAKMEDVQFYAGAYAGLSGAVTMTGTNVVFGTMGYGSLDGSEAMTVTNSVFATLQHGTTDQYNQLCVNKEVTFTNSDVYVGNLIVVSGVVTLDNNSILVGGTNGNALDGMYKTDDKIVVNKDATLAINDSTLEISSITNNGTVTIRGKSAVAINSLNGTIILDGATLTDANTTDGFYAIVGSPKDGESGTVEIVNTVTVGTGILDNVALTGSGTLNITVTSEDVNGDNDNYVLVNSTEVEDTIKITVNGNQLVYDTFVLGTDKYELSITDNGNITAKKVDPADAYVKMGLSVSASQIDGTYTFVVIPAVEGGEGRLSYEYAVTSTTDTDEEITVENGQFILTDDSSQTLTITVTATDAYGDATKVSETVDLTVKDYTAPVVESLRCDLPGTYGYQISATATDNFGTDGLTYAYFYGTSLDSPMTETADGKFTLDAAAVGSTVFYKAVVSDDAGNRTEQTGSFVVADQTAPEFTVAEVADIVWTSAVIRWNAADNIGIEKFVLSVDGQDETLSGDESEKKLSGLAAGEHKYAITAYDAAGNASAAQEGSFTIAATSPETVPSFNVGSLTGAKQEEILIGNEQNQLAAYTAGSAGYTMSKVFYGIGNWSVREIADVNGDGFEDIVMTHERTCNSSDRGGETVTDVAALLSNGSSLVFSHHDIRSFYNNDWEYLGAADVNGDGFTDILTKEPGDGENTGVNAWILNKYGDYEEDVSLRGLSSDWKTLGIGDAAGAGRENLVLFYEKDATVAYWDYNKETGSVEHVSLGSMGKEASGWECRGIGDFNGDSVDDLLWQKEDGTLLWTDSADSLAQNELGPLSDVSGYSLAGIGDFNGDGKSDLLWAGSDASLAWSNAEKDSYKNVTILA